MKKTILLICLIFIGMFVAVAGASSIQQRMKDRYPEINSLKEQHIIYENEDGYLSVYEGSAIPIVDEENADRKAVYIMIAKKRNTDPQIVGKRRAIQIKKQDAVQKGKPLNAVPADISSTIKRNCEEKWPENFRMQKYCKDEEAKAWLEMN